MSLMRKSSAPGQVGRIGQSQDRGHGRLCKFINFVIEILIQFTKVRVLDYGV
jgi:hypothetical protein